MEKHDEAVREISSQVRGFFDRKEAFRNYHGSTNSTRAVDRSRMIDTSQLNHVLQVDSHTRTAIVEPNVPMDRLAVSCLLHDMLPPVTMEFPAITVAGGYSGTSGESSSFKHGFFDSTINWIEVVIPNGEIVRASATERPDLFFGGAAALGTLGITTLFEIQLVEARRYVEVEYTPCDSVQASLALIEKTTKDPSIDYVDGIMMSLDRGIVVTGKLKDNVEPGIRVQTFSRAVDPWFYIHAGRITRRGSGSVKEAVPILDYLFRYDRGAFWMGRYAFNYFLVPFNRITRWALDGFMHTAVMYKALHASGHAEQYIIQDLALPLTNAEAFIEFINEKLGFYPLWLCPLKPPQHESMHPSAIKGDKDESDLSAEMLINIGVWCPGPTNPDKFVLVNREIEQKLQQLRGKKWLYARTFYTEDEFLSIYKNKAWYDRLRDKYHASYLPSVFEKVQSKPSISSRGWLLNRLWTLWPVSGIWGVLQTLRSDEYLLSR